MLKRTFCVLPLCAFVLLAAGETAATQPKSLTIDPTQTKVEFTLGSLLHTVHGEFHLKRGTLRFDAQSGNASGELVVDAASGDSGSPARDKRMNSAILESAKYPEITFRPDRVEGTVFPDRRSQVQLRGIFTIHGEGHEILIAISVEVVEGQYRVDGLFEVPYVKWGMKNPSTLMLRVSDKVVIAIQTVLRPM